jgi:hypothetical protein
MMEVDKVNPSLKEEDKDENYWRCLNAHREYMAKTFGVPRRMKSTFRIPLPFKVRHGHSEIKSVICDAKCSHILHISLELAPAFKPVFTLAM